jgi:uncharacterized protein YqeY
LSITERIQADTTAAAKAQDRERLAALRLILDALNKEAKEARGALDEQREIAVLSYLPAEISDDELESLVADALSETGAVSRNEMGKVMSAVMAKAGGRADGKRVSELVRSKLS